MSKVEEKNLEEMSEEILDEAFEKAISDVDETSEPAETEEETAEDSENEETNEINETEDVEEEEKDSDDEFMESITEQKMSPEQAKKKIAFWEDTIAKAEERIEELEPIHQVYTNDGLVPVMDEVKKALEKNIADENVKEITKNAKLIDAIHVVTDLIRDLNSNYVQNKRDIEKAQSEIERIGAVQLDIFDDAESTQNDTEDTNTQQSPSVEPTGDEVSEEAA